MNTILTDDERREIQRVWLAEIDAGVEDLIRKVEAAVLAKLREQEPVAWRITVSVKHRDGTVTHTHQFRATKVSPLDEPLYAAPLPAAPEAPAQGEPHRAAVKTVTDQLLTGASAGFEQHPEAPAQGNDCPACGGTGSGGMGIGCTDCLGSGLDPRGPAPEEPAQAAPSADEVERGDVVAFEFYNRATGHAIVDYSVNTHVGNLSADKGYEARPLVYADKREEVTDGSKPIPLWQAREALDELEAAARGDEPFNHFAAGLVRSALEQAAAPEAPAQTSVPAPWREAVKAPKAIEAAAKMLCARMDYPWDYMPEKGREEMRKNAAAILEAAIAQLDALEGGE